MNSLVRAARRLADNPTARSAVQGQIDRITRAQAPAGPDSPPAGAGDPMALDSGAPERGASAAGGMGAIVGSLAGGMASLKGLSALGKQLQANGSWLEGIQKLTSQLSPDQLRTAAQEAVAALPDSVRTDLAGRLASQAHRLPAGVSPDLTGAVSGYLRENGGAQQLLSVLMVARAGPGGVALSLMSAMKDPAVRELVKSIISALVSVKGRGAPR